MKYGIGINLRLPREIGKTVISWGKFAVSWISPCLKKQTQLTAAQIGVNSYLKGYYGNKPPYGAQKNKANQSQSKLAPSTAQDYCWELKKQSQFSLSSN